MFTGIVEELGTVVAVKRSGDGVDATFRAAKVGPTLSVDNSIAVNGVCLTVVQRSKNQFSVNIVRETLLKTNLGTLKKGDGVNLERPVKLNDRLGGHLVLGHCDGVGVVKKIDRLKGSWMFHIAFSPDRRKLLIPVGSVAVDGVSLTVARLSRTTMSIAIIPYTHEHTLFGRYSVGSMVNLEFDVVGKYIESIMTFGKQ